MKLLLIFQVCFLSAVALGAGAPPYIRNPWDTNAVPEALTHAWTGSNNFGGQTLVQHALISSLDTSQLQPVSNGTNFAVDFNVPVTKFTPTNHIFFLYSTNFWSGGSQDKVFVLKGSTNNFKVGFGSNMTNFYGTYSSNNYVLGNSNGPHLIAVHIDGAHGSETVAIVPPNN